MKYIMVFICSFILGDLANASFYIDYQGLERGKVEHIKQSQLITPDGYRLLTDGLKGLVFEIGPRKKQDKTSAFADDTILKDSIGALLPKGWSAFLDERLSGDVSITFSAENEFWLETLARIGGEYGFKFVVDWEQELVQISRDEYYIEPNPNEPVVVESENGQTYFIYKSKQSLDKGMVIINGEMVPLKVKS
jgi:hypothetical protein